MRHIVPLVWEALRGDIAEGKAIDPDAHFDRFKELFPELEDKTLRMIIMEAAAALCSSPLREPREK